MTLKERLSAELQEILRKEFNGKFFNRDAARKVCLDFLISQGIDNPPSIEVQCTDDGIMEIKVGSYPKESRWN